MPEYIVGHVVDVYAFALAYAERLVHQAIEQTAFLRRERGHFRDEVDIVLEGFVGMEVHLTLMQEVIKVSAHIPGRMDLVGFRKLHNRVFVVDRILFAVTTGSLRAMAAAPAPRRRLLVT